MATTANPPPGAFAVDDPNGPDPFFTGPQDPQRQRYSAFDKSQFSLYLNGSPAQAKRALQAHLAETTRRLQETSHLGNALVSQRQELEEKLKEVETQQESNEIGPELRQRLAELEKEYNEVGRETARAFLPKSRVPSGETDTNAGASVYSSESHHSPTKVSVPSRKQRNQQPSRIHDITLATEISTSLLSQLKELQAVLSEKDEALRAASLDRSQLEIEVEGLSQRLRTLDESESRLKDVNWSLETQVREFEVLSKAATDKESRLNHSLNLAKSEKSSLERELEEVKQLYSKVNDDLINKTKQHETEIGGLRRNVSMGEAERGALARKVEELATQNQDLARAVAYRVRSEDQSNIDDTSPEDAGEEGDTMTPEHSPPPSPSKATPRHGQLESETLKHSLHHAHRMIQQLKNNIHREKTEKIELKRMLQDARDELDTNRHGLNVPGSAGKRKKNDKDLFKKPARPDRLGALRTGSQEVVEDDEDWEEHEALQNTPSRRSRRVEDLPGAFPSGFSSAAETGPDDFDTANEANSDAFETANEREGTTTETDAFQTGAETLDGDSSDDLTETEDGAARATRPSLSTSGNRNSYHSTASTSGDDTDNLDIRTPIQSQHPRLRLKLRQGGYRRPTPRSSQEVSINTPPAARDSPASFVSNESTPPVQGKSLFAELGNFSESEDGSVAEGTPSRSSLLSPESSPEILRRSLIERSPLQSVAVSKPVMIDSAMMTEPWASDLPTIMPAAPQLAAVSSMATQHTQPVSPQVQTAPHPTLHPSVSIVNTTPRFPTVSLPPFQRSTIAAQGTEPVLPVVPAPSVLISSVSHQATEPSVIHPVHLSVSSIWNQATEPKQAPRTMVAVSPLSQQSTEPLERQSQPFALSSISRQTTEPRETLPFPTAISSISAQESKPVGQTTTVPFITPVPVPYKQSSTPEEVTDFTDAPRSQAHTTEPPESLARVTAPLQFSALSAQGTSPVETPKGAPLQLSVHSSLATEPVGPSKPTPSKLSVVSSLATEPVQLPRQELSQLPVFTTHSTSPVEPLKAELSQSSVISSQATEPVEHSKLALSSIAPVTTHHTSPVEPLVRQAPPSKMSEVLTLQHTQPESPTLPSFLPSPSRPSTANRVLPTPLVLSSIMAQQTEPAVPSRPVTAHRAVPVMLPASNAPALSDERKIGTEAAKSGYFDSERSRGKSEPHPISGGTDGRTPLAPLNSNIKRDRSSSPKKGLRTPTADEGTQTMVSAVQIDQLLMSRNPHRSSGAIAAAGVEKQLSPPASPGRTTQDSNRTPRRPGSSSSMRSRSADMPPLPSDYQKQIDEAARKAPISIPAPTTPGLMGPPGAPASAYKKRPQTPTIKTQNIISSPKTGGTTPRARYQAPRSDAGRSGASSPITRRSSVSSFVSEVNTSFGNINGLSFGQSGLDPNTTDPRMIQAITQTMIGEFLWKYTRKAGRENMSENRHRRFFWVHPYTRTLYWSEQDPATAGRAQLKAKSVAIESVEVVSDDNPFPPGLHRKSLVIKTPGRAIKFTATTGQRHETWFNALSYLLLRTEENEEGQAQSRVQKEAAHDEIQAEFNAGGFRSSSRQTTRSRASVSSYLSRRTSSPHHAQIPTLRPSMATSQRTSSGLSEQGTATGRLSSLSGMFRPSNALRTSISGRHGRQSQQEQATDERDANSEEADRILIEKTPDNGGEIMEDVRVCCGGKHTVGDLHHHHHQNQQYGSQTNRQSSAKAVRHASFAASIASSIGSRSHSRTSVRKDEAGH